MHVLDAQIGSLILHHLAEGLFAVDRLFNITYFNPHAEQITGFTRQEAVGRPCYEVFRTSICGKDCPLRQSMTAGRTVRNVEIDILTRQGKQLRICVSTAPLINGEGAFIGGVETFRESQISHEGARLFDGIGSRNQTMRRVFEILPNVAMSDAPVLIEGSSGTGKALLAETIHQLGPRSSSPMTKVNCSSMSAEQIEAEVFGDQASSLHNGTLLLKEIGSLPGAIQSKLVRLLETQESQGKSSVRLIASTSEDLRRLSQEKRIRDDLYYRLKVIVIRLPDLVDRREDIPLLVERIITRLNQRLGRSVNGLTDEALTLLTRHSFPGNVRELENIIEHMFVVARGKKIQVEDLPPFLVAGRQRQTPDERDQLRDCLQRHMWSIPKAAAELGMHRTTLWRKVKRLGITRP